MNKYTSSSLDYKEFCIRILCDRLKKTEERLINAEASLIELQEMSRKYDKYELMKDSTEFETDDKKKMALQVRREQRMCSIKALYDNIYKRKYAKEKYNRLEKFVEDHDVDGLIDIVYDTIRSREFVDDERSNLAVALKTATGLTYPQIDKLANMTYDEIVKFIKEHKKSVEENTKTLNEDKQPIDEVKEFFGEVSDQSGENGLEKFDD